MEVRLSDIIKFYKDSPEQQEAIQMLQEAMPEELLEVDAAWHKRWLEHGNTEPLGPRDAWLKHK